MGSIIVSDLQINSYDVYFIGYYNSLVPFDWRRSMLLLIYVSVNNTHLRRASCQVSHMLVKIHPNSYFLEISSKITTIHLKNLPVGSELIMRTDGRTL
jgi:hypothetical protein